MVNDEEAGEVDELEEGEGVGEGVGDDEEADKVKDQVLLQSLQLSVESFAFILQYQSPSFKIGL